MKTSQGWAGFVPKYYNRTPFAKNCHRWIKQTIYFLVGIRGAGTSKQSSSGPDQQASGWDQATGIHAGFPQLCQIFTRSTGWPRAWIKRRLVMGDKCEGTKSSGARLHYSDLSWRAINTTRARRWGECHTVTRRNTACSHLKRVGDKRDIALFSPFALT